MAERRIKMTLREACDIGDACGLTTVGEAITNIEIHNVFSHSKMAAEFAELYADAKNVPDDTPISKILGDGAGMA